nr:probable E3 ubiquitin-protein ligase TRIM8 [Paramormyrops kingsleyae]
MAATFVNCFREELICFICREVYEDPVRLSCRHNFCRQCILRTFSANEDVVHCPECNMPYYAEPRLTKNLKLANIVASFKALDALIPSAAPEGAKCVPSYGQALCGTEVPRDNMKQELLKHQEKIGEQMQAMVANLNTAEAVKQQAEESFEKTREMVKAHYQKMHELLVQDMQRTLHTLDTAHSRFCLDNSAQVSQFHERQQEAEQLLSSVKAALNKLEDINSMKDTAEMQILLNRSEAYTSENRPLPNQGHLRLRRLQKKISEKEKSLQELLEGPPSTSMDVNRNSSLSQSRLQPTKAIKRKRLHSSTGLHDNGCDSSSCGPVSKRRYTTQGSAGPLSAPGPSSTPRTMTLFRPDCATRPSSPPWTSTISGPISSSLLFNTSEAYTSENRPLPNQGHLRLRRLQKKISEKEKSLQELLEGPPSTSMDVNRNSSLSQSRLQPTKAIKRKRLHSSTGLHDNGCDSSSCGPDDDIIQARLCN